MNIAFFWDWIIPSKLLFLMNFIFLLITIAKLQKKVSISYFLKRIILMVVKSNVIEKDLKKACEIIPSTLNS